VAAVVETGVGTEVGTSIGVGVGVEVAVENVGPIVACNVAVRVAGCALGVAESASTAVPVGPDVGVRSIPTCGVPQAARNSTSRIPDTKDIGVMAPFLRALSLGDILEPPHQQRTILCI